MKANLAPSAEPMIINKTNEEAKFHRQDEATKAILVPSAESKIINRTNLKTSDNNTNTPSTEWKENTPTEQDIHNDCITRTMFVQFLNKCEEIS